MKKTKTAMDGMENNNDFQESEKKIIAVFLSDYVDVTNHPSGHQQITGSFKNGVIISDKGQILSLIKKGAPIELYEKIDGIHTPAEG